MVPVVAAQHAHVQREPGVLREGTEEVIVEAGRQGAAVEEATAQIQRGLDEGIVHGDDGVTVACARGRRLLAQSEAERDGDVLDEVVAQVACRRHLEREAGVAGEGSEHVVQEGVGGGDGRGGVAILAQSQADAYTRLVRLPGQRCHGPNSRAAAAPSMAPV